MLNKVIKYLVIVAIAIIGGYGFGLLIVQSSLFELWDTVPKIPLVLLFILAFIVSVTIHELSHAFYFILHKVEMRLIGIFVFIFLNNHGKWKFTIFYNAITLTGGIAIPNLPTINSKESFAKIQKIYSRALLFGPIVSFILTIISLAIYIMLEMTSLLTAYPYLAFFSVFCVFFGLVIVASSFVKTDVLYGDFHAYKTYKDNDVFAALQFNQYMSFNYNWKETLSESQWLLHYILDYTHKIDCKQLTLMDIRVLDWVIQLDYYHIIQLDAHVQSTLKEIIEENRLLSVKQSEERDTFYHHVLFTLYKYSILSKEQLQKHYSEASEELLKGHPSQEYYKQMTNHVLFSVDNHEWMNEPKNINPHSTYSLFKIFDAVVEIEKAFYQTQPNEKHKLPDL